MKKIFPLWMLGIVAMLASCSQDETLQDATNHSRTTTITATISDGMKTRADATNEELAAITRCKLVVYAKGETTNPIADETVNVQNNDNSFTFTLDLDEGDYDFYCWADDGTSYNLENGLGSITVSTTGNKPGIAHEGKALAQKSGEPITIPLQHAVAKVVLQTTANITADKSASVTVQTHTGYSVFDGKVAASTSSITETKAIATTDATVDNPAEVLSFYVLVDKDEEPQASVTVAYGDDNIQVANVPIKADCRTILKGDLTALAFPETPVTAALDTDWDEETKEFPVDINTTTHTITLSKAGSLTATLIEQAIANGTEITLTISGPMDETDAQALHDYFYGEFEPKDTHVSTLDMSGVTGLTAIKDDTFYNATYLKKVILPASVTSIGDWAFVGSGLETLTADNVTSVGQGAFSWCEKLTELSLPSVTTFGNNDCILETCTSLTTLKLTSPDFDGVFSGNFFYGTTTENIDLYLHKNLESYVYKGSDASTGNIIYQFYNPSNQYLPIAEFKSITLVDDSGNPVDESTL